MRALILLLLLIAAPAAAQDSPVTMPTRDVDVIYRMAGPAGALEQRMRWGVSLGKLRVDPPTPGLYVVLDTRNRQMQTVREAERTVLQTDAGPGAIPGTPPAGRYTRRNPATVSGLACTNWETIDSRGAKILACLTDDGVLLQAESAGVVFVFATEIRYAPLNASVFAVPPDYKRIIAPQMSR